MGLRFVSVGVLAGLLVGGCAGEDVPLGPSRAALGAAECAMAPGEDVCGRAFRVGPQERAPFVALAGRLTAFAGEARERAERVRDACDALSVELGGEKAAIGEDLAGATQDACAHAAARVEVALVGAAASLESDASRCSTTPRAACLTGPDGAPLVRTSCADATVRVVLAEGATAAALRAARAVERHAGALVAAHVEINALPDLVGEIASPIPGTEHCSGDLSALAISARDETSAVVTSANRVLVAVMRP